MASIIARRPRAPDLRLSASRAIALKRARGELQMDILHIEQLLILAHQRVLRLGEDPHQGVLIEFTERRDDRQTSDKLRNQTELQQVFRLHFS